MPWDYRGALLLVIGSDVIVHGDTSKPQLNDRLGTVVEALPNDRVAVLLFGTLTPISLSVKSVHPQTSLF